MSINKYNSEGYYDPTTYEALTNIEKEEKAEQKSAYLPLVYVCSPFAGDVESNTKNARDFCRFALNKGNIPFAPHLLFPQFMNDNNPSEREQAMHFNYVMLGKCDELWVLGDVISKGMSIEIAVAEKRKMSIKYWNGACEEVLK